MPGPRRGVGLGAGLGVSMGEGRELLTPSSAQSSRRGRHGESGQGAGMAGKGWGITEGAWEASRLCLVGPGGGSREGPALRESNPLVTPAAVVMVTGQTGAGEQEDRLCPVL